MYVDFYVYVFGFCMWMKLSYSQNSNSIYQGCNQTIFEGQGFIVSPNYPYPYLPNSYCTWSINVEVGRIVRLGFRHFDIESTVNCAYDSLTVYNGPSINHPQIGKFCGAFRPGILDSTSNKMMLVFNSDDSRSRTGFIASFMSAEPVLANQESCGGLMTSYKGSFHSLNYPKAPYPMGKTCSWHIKVTPNRNIVLNFRTFQIEQSKGCIYDAVIVYGAQSDSTDTEFIGRFCGDVVPPDILSSGNEMFVTFISDSSGADIGFEASYIALEPIPEIDNQPICSETFIIEGKNGSIISPGYGLDKQYSPNLLCSWKIIVPVGMKIQITFKEFQLNYDQNCSRDYVAVFDSGNAVGHLLGRICGNVSGTTMSSSRNVMYLSFKTDYVGRTSGFKAQYVSIPISSRGRTSSETKFLTPREWTTAIPPTTKQFLKTTPDCPKKCPKKKRLVVAVCAAKQIFAVRIVNIGNLRSSGTKSLVTSVFKGDLLHVDQTVNVKLPCGKCPQKITRSSEYLVVGSRMISGSLELHPGDFVVRYKTKKHKRAVIKALNKCRSRRSAFNRKK